MPGPAGATPRRACHRRSAAARRVRDHSSSSRRPAPAPPAASASVSPPGEDAPRRRRPRVTPRAPHAGFAGGHQVENADPGRVGEVPEQRVKVLERRAGPAGEASNRSVGHINSRPDASRRDADVVRSLAGRDVRGGIASYRLTALAPSEPGSADRQHAVEQRQWSPLRLACPSRPGASPARGHQRTRGTHRWRFRTCAVTARH